MTSNRLVITTENRFRFDPVKKSYSIKADNISYVMPYVLTLRLTRYLKGNLKPTSDQLKEWYASLPFREKLLVSFDVA